MLLPVDADAQYDRNYIYWVGRQCMMENNYREAIDVLSVLDPLRRKGIRRLLLPRHRQIQPRRSVRRRRRLHGGYREESRIYGRLLLPRHNAHASGQLRRRVERFSGGYRPAPPICRGHITAAALRDFLTSSSNRPSTTSTSSSSRRRRMPTPTSTAARATSTSKTPSRPTTTTTWPYVPIARTPTVTTGAACSTCSRSVTTRRAPISIRP